MFFSHIVFGRQKKIWIIIVIQLFLEKFGLRQNLCFLLGQRLGLQNWSLNQKKDMEAIIFDFDGVIIESLNLKKDAFVEIYKPFGQEIVAKVIDFHLKNGGMSRYEKIAYCHKNFLNKEISELELKELVKGFSDIVLDKIASCPFVEGVREFIEGNYQRYKMFVSSGTPDFEIKKTVEMIGIKNYFKGVYGSAQSKKEHIKQILGDYFLFPQQVIFIGDALKDKEAADATGLNFIARISGESSALKTEKYQITDFYSIDETIKEIEMSNLIC